MPTRYLRQKTYRKHWLSDKKLLEVFPDVKDIIGPKLVELEEEKLLLEVEIRERISDINKNVHDEFSRWFYKHWIQINLGEDLVKLDMVRTHLKVFEMRLKNHLPKFYIRDEEIERARAVPVQILIGQYVDLKPTSNGWIGTCPFHKENHPSFHLYKESNNYHCFGCGKHGDSIQFLIDYSSLTFKEAVRFLQNV